MLAYPITNQSRCAFFTAAPLTSGLIFRIASKKRLILAEETHVNNLGIKVNTL
jgi:hypothetical protein